MQDPMTSASPGDAPAIPLSPERPQGAASANAGDGAKAMAGNAAHTASSLAGQAKDKLSGALEEQKGGVADLVQNLAQTVHRSGEQFKGQQDWIASAVERGAAELDTLATSLRERNLGDLAGQAQVFARRQPALFMGAALAAGFAVARLGKVVAGDLSRDDLPSMPEVGNVQH